MSIDDIAHPDIKPASAGRSIPVVLTVDRNFLRGALATIRSIVESPGEDPVAVHVCHNDITAGEQKDFLAKLPSGGRVTVDFVDITAAIEKYGISKLKHSMWFTQATSYRLLLPSIFPGEDRLIFLDADLVVLHDLGELYRTDLRGNWLAAVRGFGYPNFVAKHKKRQEWHKETGLPVETYFNAGMLLIDCAAFREHDLVAVLMNAALEKSFAWPDQDALNLICRGHALLLDDRWNVTVASCRKRAGEPGGEHFAKLLENPYILHYTGSVKPWHDPKSFKADVWWRFSPPDLDVADGSRASRKDINLPRQSGEKTVDVSVVIPTHRRHLFLRTALQSVFSQEDVSFEVTVINGIEDDADTDGVVAEFDGVNYIRSKEYLSCSSKRALGLSRAKGRYIHFIDDDDYLIDNGFYRKAAAFLDANADVAFFSGNARLRRELASEGEPAYEDSILPFSGRVNGLEYFSKLQLEWRKPDSTCTTMFRTAALIEGDELKEVNDSSIYLQALLHGNAYIIKDFVAVYRIWNGSICFGGEGNDLRLKMETAIQKERFYYMASSRIADVDKWWRGTFAMNLDYFRQSTPDKMELLLFAAWGILHSHGDKQLVDKCVSELATALPGTFAMLRNHIDAPKLLLHLRAMLHKVFAGVSGNFEPYYSEIMAGLDAEIGKRRGALDVGLMYFDGFRNFGDLLSCRLMECLSGLGMNCRSMPAADIAAVGSILRQLLRCFNQANASSGPLHVWGSGFPRTITLQNPPAKGRVIFHAVRGMLTLRHLRELGLAGPEESVPLGDPGLLYADIVPGVSETRKEFDVAIVPHYLDREVFKTVAGELSSRGLSVKFVDVANANPMQVVRDIAASRRVLSSSLHGIIVADSLGIPNQRVVVDGFEEDEKRMLDESHLKFADYYSAFGLERPKHIYLSELKSAPRRTIDSIVDFVPRDKVEKCKRELLDAFPLPRREAFSVARDEHQAPDVSVIVPVYNSEYYLRECLDSVLLQQATSLELICVDDGSTDSSAKIVEDCAARDGRVKLIRQKNLGPGVARNAGLDAAKGEYVFFLDADDRLSSGAALRQAYERAKADDLDILIADGSVMAESGTVENPNAYLRQSLLPGERVFAPEALGADLYLVSPMSPWAKLFRRSFLAENKLFFPALKRSEDFPMVQLALSLSRRIGAIVTPMIDRRIGVSTSLESTKDETPLVFIEAERIFREELGRRGLSGRFGDAVNAAFVVRLAYNIKAVRAFASYKAILDEMKGPLAGWTSCSCEGETSDAYQKAKAYLDDLSKALSSNPDIVQMFVDNCTERARTEAAKRIEQIERESGKLKSALQEAQRSRGELFTRLQESQKSRSELFAKLQESQRSRGELFSKLQESQRSRGELFSKLQESQRSRGELFSKVQEAQKSRGELFSKLQESQKSRGELFSKLQESQRSRGELFSKLQESQRSRGELFSKLQEAQRSRGRLFTQLQESQKSRGELVKKLQKEQADSKIARESQDRLIGEYKAVLDQINEVVK